MMEVSYALAFTTGIIGGFGHCIGMCGPVVTAFTLNAEQPGRTVHAVSYQLLYNAGRISTYGFMGSLMGLAGSAVNIAGKLSGFQNGVSILAGIIMIIMGAGLTGVFGRKVFVEGKSVTLVRMMRAVLESASPWRYFPFGILLGFMPCGLSWSIFIGAAGSGNMLTGFLFAVVFGAGTVPALLLIGLAARWLTHRFRMIVYSAGGVFVIITGLYYIVLGARSYAGL